MYRFIYTYTYAYMHILFVDGFAVIWAGDHPTDICIYTYTFCRWSTIYRVHRHGAGAHAPQHMYSHSRIFFTFCTFGDIGIGGIDMFSHIENHSYSSHFCCCCVLVCVGGDLLGISSGRCKCGSRWTFLEKTQFCAKYQPGHRVYSACHYRGGGRGRPSGKIKQNGKPGLYDGYDGLKDYCQRRLLKCGWCSWMSSKLQKISVLCSKRPTSLKRSVL